MAGLAMRHRLRSIIGIGLALLAIGSTAPMMAFDLLGGDSECHGTPANGRVTNAVRMPLWGETYRTYCVLCAFALRTYGHDKAIQALETSFHRMATQRPGTRFVYGEVGFPWGGPFRPHRTHRNGLSLDIMVPLRDGKTLPTHALNRFGYDEEFDHHGNGTAGDIDFEALHWPFTSPR